MMVGRGSRRRIALSALLLLATAFAIGVRAEPEPFGRTTTIDMPKRMRVEAAELADVDGDGASDLVIAASRGGKRERRELRVHLRRSGTVAFGPEPDMTFALLPDVVAFAVGDVHADPGAEIVLFTPSGAFALRPGVATEKDRYVRLAEADFLWQLPHSRRIVAWQDGVRDLNGDGLVDLVLPESSGYTIAIQARSATAERRFASSHLRLPDGGATTPVARGARRMRGRQRSRRVSVSLQIGSGGVRSGDLLTVNESVPAPRFIDWDGDGDLDLLAQTTAELLVWIQPRGAPFRTPPDIRIALPLEVDRRRLLDVSYAAHATDLDGDGRCDYVLVAGNQTSEDPQAQVAVYRRARNEVGGARPLFGEKGLPTQLLVVAGLAGVPEFPDVDGDGLPDLVMGSLRLDALDALRAATGSTLDAELYVYRNRGGTFTKQPVLTHEVSLTAKGLRGARRNLIARFIGDATGDGVSELLMREDRERLRLLMVRRTKNALTVIERPLWETSVDDDADLVIAPGGPGAPPEILVLSARSLLHVRFGK